MKTEAKKYQRNPGRLERLVRPRRMILFSDRRKLADEILDWQIKNGAAKNTLSALAALQVMGWIQRPTRTSLTKKSTNIYAAKRPNIRS